MECQELVVDAQSDDESLPEDSNIRKWCANQEAAAQKAGLTLKISGELLRKRMTEAGFENIVVREFKLPVGPWPADSRLKEIGRFQLVAMLEGIYGLTIALWTRFLGWNAQEVELFLALVRNEFKSIKVDCYWPLYVVSPSLHPGLTTDTLGALGTLYTDRSRGPPQIDKLGEKVDADVVACPAALLVSKLSLKGRNTLEPRRRLLR